MYIRMYIFKYLHTRVGGNNPTSISFIHRFVVNVRFEKIDKLCGFAVVKNPSETGVTKDFQFLL